MNLNEFHAMLLKHRQPRQCTRGIYFLFKDDDIVYIDQSEIIERTIHEHNRDKDFDSYSMLKIVGELDSKVEELIVQYQPKYNVQPNKFNPFDYYKQHISARLSSPQTNMMIYWMKNVPTELLKEGMDRVIEKCPDNPFGFLKSIIEDWMAKEFKTLEDIQKADENHQNLMQPRIYSNDSKGVGKRASIQRDIEQRGHHQGIPAGDW